MMRWSSVIPPAVKKRALLLAAQVLIGVAFASRAPRDRRM